MHFKERNNFQWRNNMKIWKRKEKALPNFSHFSGWNKLWLLSSPKAMGFLFCWSLCYLECNSVGLLGVGTKFRFGGSQWLKPSYGRGPRSLLVCVERDQGLPWQGHNKHPIWKLSTLWFEWDATGFLFTEKLYCISVCYLHLRQACGYKFIQQWKLKKYI